jgi:hypothetical protein
MRRMERCLLSEPFTLMVVLMLLWRQSILQGFVCVLRHRETLSAGLLNSLKEQEVCVCVCVCVRDKRVKGRKLNAFVRTEEFAGAARDAITKSPRKSVRPLVQQIGVAVRTARKAEAAAAAAVGRWSSESLRFCDGVSTERCWRTVRVLNVTWFSNETHFRLKCYIKKQNIRSRAPEISRLAVASTLRQHLRCTAQYRVT